MRTPRSPRQNHSYAGAPRYRMPRTAPKFCPSCGSELERYDEYSVFCATGCRLYSFGHIEQPGKLELIRAAFARDPSKCLTNSDGTPVEMK